MATARNPLRGTWRIIDTEVWDSSALDEFTEARLTLDQRNLGELAFLCVSADVDYRVGVREGCPAIEFSFNGTDELDPVSGRGWAVLHGDELRGRLFFHRGDESAFIAKRNAPKRRAAV